LGEAWVVQWAISLVDQVITLSHKPYRNRLHSPLPYRLNAFDGHAFVYYNSSDTVLMHGYHHPGNIKVWSERIANSVKRLF